MSDEPRVRRRRRRRSFLRRHRRLLVALAVVTVVVSLGAAVALRLRARDAHVERLRGEARILRRIGDLEEAADTLVRARALAPEDADLAVQLALVHAAAGRPADAEATLRAALTETADPLAVTTPLASLLLGDRRAAEADALLGPLLANARAHHDPGTRARVLILAGQTASATGDPARGEALLREAADGAETKERATALAALGALLATQDRSDEALTTYGEAILVAPGDVAIATAFARLHEHLGDRAAAVAVLRPLVLGQVEGGPRIDAVQPLCDILLGAGLPEDALALAEEVERAPSGRAAAAFVRAMVALARADLPGAEAQVETVARLLPNAPWPRLLIGRIALRRRAPGRARAAFEAALELDPLSADAELALLDLDLAERKTDDVRERAERVLARRDLRPAAIRALLASHGRSVDPVPALEGIRKLHERFPDELVVHSAYAQALIRAGEVEAGIAALTQLVAERPEAPEPVTRLAQAHAQQANTIEAIDELARLAGDPRLAPARLVLAQLYLTLQRPDLASRELDRAIADDPTADAARIARARLAAAANDLPRATAELEAVLEHAPERVDVLGLLARLRTNAGDYERAVEALEKATAQQPGNATLHIQLALALAAAGRLDASLASFAKGRSLAPRIPEAHYDGAALLARGQPDAAVTAFRRGREATGDARFGAALAAALALAGDPTAGVGPLQEWRVERNERTEGAIAHAMLLALSGDGRAAARVAANAQAPAEVRAAAAAVRSGANGELDASTRTALEMFALGVLGAADDVRQRAAKVASDGTTSVLLSWWALRGYGRRADHRTRATLARRLDQLAPGDPGVRLELAHALGLTGDTAGQLAALRSAAETSPDDPRVALALAKAMDERGHQDAAIAQYRRAIDLAPDAFPVARNNLAWLLRDEPGQLSRAIEHARLAVAQQPRGAFLDTLGWLLYRDGRLEQAAATLARAASLEPADPSIRLHLARVLADQGHPTRAIAHLRTALIAQETDAGPIAAEAQELLERLESEGRFLEAVDPTKTAPLVRGESASLAPGASQQASRRIEPTAEGTEERLRIRAPRSGAELLVTRKDGALIKRVVAGTAEEVILPRLALPAEGALATLRFPRDAPTDAVATLELTPTPSPPNLAREPDETIDSANDLVPGAEITGAFDGASDRDHVRLRASPREGARITIEAGPRGELRAELLAVQGALEKQLKLLTVPRGTETVLTIQVPERAIVSLRLTPGSKLDPASTTTPAGTGRDWSVDLTTVEALIGDAEPNDRMEEASLLPVERPTSGHVGIGDPVDWYRLDGRDGDVVRIQLTIDHPDKEAPIAAELWERTTHAVLPSRRWTLSERTFSVERWRLPSNGELFLAIVRPLKEIEQSYRVQIEQADSSARPTAETEPNDRAEFAEAASAEMRVTGTLAKTDADWVSIPAVPTGTSIALRCRVVPSTIKATLTIFSPTGPNWRYVSGYETKHGILDVPALALPGPSFVVIEGTSDSTARWELEIGPAEPTDGREVEPNDEIPQAIPLAAGRTVSGVLSGSLDRDILRVDGRRALIVSSDGRSAAAVNILGSPGSRHRLDPGSSIVLSPADLGRQGGALVEIYSWEPAGADAKDGLVTWRAQSD